MLESRESHFEPGRQYHARSKAGVEMPISCRFMKRGPAWFVAAIHLRSMLDQEVNNFEIAAARREIGSLIIDHLRFAR